MKNYLPTVFLLLLTICFSCGEKMEHTAALTNSTAIAKAKLPAVLQKGLKAHGGLDRWNSMKALSYAYQREGAKEIQQIALDNRKCKIERTDVFTLGYDGEEVWVSPNKEAFGKGSARFYHNLIFYFYAMPFVLADPGIIYSEVPPMTLDGKIYPGVKITYQDNVGDAPDDYYIAYFDDNTGELYLLLYTVTYYNGAPNEKFKALIYEDWMEVNGLKLPKTLSGYKFEADTLGAKRYQRIFTEVTISEEDFPASLFARPQGAEIDSLIVHQ